MTNAESSDSNCPCGSKKLYAECCQLFHLHKSVASTPEQLMRSRYAAYALGGLGQYLVDTWHPDYLNGLSANELNQTTSNWIGLNVISSSISKTGKQGQVEFIAAFDDLDGSGPRQFLHECSYFENLAGLWLYTQGDIKAVKYPKRNEPCLCGSGLKFKKCCAAFV